MGRGGWHAQREREREREWLGQIFFFFKHMLTKTRAQGYDHNHRDIELLRLRSLTLGRKVEDDEIVGPGGLGRVAELVLAMSPFVSLADCFVPGIGHDWTP